MDPVKGPWQREIEERLKKLEQERQQIPMPLPVPFPDPPQYPPQKPQCSKCGLQLHDVMGYVCPRTDCPTGLGPTLCGGS